MKLLAYFLITLVIYFFSKKYNILLDYPTERKNHHKPTPQIGGVILFTILLFFFDYPFLILFSLLLFGILDDMFKLSYKQKFVFEIIIALYIVFKYNITLFGMRNIFTNIFAIFWIIAFLNGLNMIDGLNGLSTGVSIIYLSMLSQFELALSYFPIYIFNFFGKLFMGESGILITGFILLSSALLIENDMVYLTIFFGYPFYEVVASFIRRVISKENPFLADRKHLHHILSKKMGNLFLPFSYLLTFLFASLPKSYMSIFYYLSISIILFLIHFGLIKKLNN
ncbi:UDP-GlcNAc:undecaprenyl-phosphate GlcNAc-1-phosphate transferase [Thermosipho japonicus]|uniref:UDP-GlcNAc:undecaprenyl-phosphate GlcNAc-1-phosphate transferase n=1 Tax=Thermosipho japonicus TaxID=90323 RepID=A0A841GS79_9BACT|nr:MraY family glycosyltransferase [Thermosipho japonicus]MBB6062833.1 UDP-GlcNAc:undecaprenyl-phosphate GlcNAc-1-phosphate transferase [Thermosipho japonicus]